MISSGGLTWLSGCRRLISSCRWCFQHKGICAKSPMWLIIVTTPLELLHVDNDGVGSTPQTWWTFWSFATILGNTSWGMWPPIKLQKLLLSFCGRFMSQFLEHQPSFWVKQGANFKSNIIRELCKLMGIWKVRISPYHAQINGQVAWAHQMLMHMIGKLSKDWKADWLKHLPKLVHAYNSMRSANTGYIPHYLMFRCWSCLPINFYFPTERGTQKHQGVDHHIAEQHEWLREAFKEAMMQSTSEVERQSGTTIGS